jgi:hypothetical protein
MIIIDSFVVALVASSGVPIVASVPTTGTGGWSAVEPAVRLAAGPARVHHVAEPAPAPPVALVLADFLLVELLFGLPLGPVPAQFAWCCSLVYELSFQRFVAASSVPAPLADVVYSVFRRSNPDDRDFDHTSGIPIGPCLAPDAQSDRRVRCSRRGTQIAGRTAGLPLFCQSGAEIRSLAPHFFPRLLFHNYRPFGFSGSVTHGSDPCFPLK